MKHCLSCLLYYIKKWVLGCSARANNFLRFSSPYMKDSVACRSSTLWNRNYKNLQTFSMTNFEVISLSTCSSRFKEFVYRKNSLHLVPNVLGYLSVDIICFEKLGHFQSRDASRPIACKLIYLMDINLSLDFYCTVEPG